MIPVRRLLVMMMKAGMSLEPIKSDVSDAMNVTSTESLEQPSPLEAESAAGYGQDVLVSLCAPCWI